MTTEAEGGKPTVPELTQAVRDLSVQVQALNNKLEEEYPDHSQVKSEGRWRAVKTLAFGVVLILIAQFVTISLVSYCFLAPSGTIHKSCYAMPGYERTLTTGNERLARFELLIEEIEKNRKLNREQEIQIQILEAEVKELKAELRQQR